MLTSPGSPSRTAGRPARTPEGVPHVPSCRALFSSECASPSRQVAARAVAGFGVGIGVQTSISSPSLDRITSPPSISGSPASAPKAARPANAALQILIQAAARATRAVQQRVEMTQLQSKLESCRSFAALQMLALQHQNGLEQQGVIAFLKRATQLAATTPMPTQQDQYACSRFLESIALSCASLIPAMAPATVAGLLGTLGALVVGGLVPRKQVPYHVVVLVQALALASLPQLHVYNGQQLAHAIRACALLSPSGIPEIWLDDWEACTQDKITSMTPDALSAILTALVVLREGQSWLPSGRWLDAYMAAAQPSLPAFRGADLREMLNGLTGLGCDPEPEWMESFKGALSARAVAMDPSDLGAVLFALTKMKVQFP